MLTDQELVRLYRNVKGTEPVHLNPGHVAALRRVAEAATARDLAERKAKIRQIIIDSGKRQEDG